MPRSSDTDAKTISAASSAFRKMSIADHRRGEAGVEPARNATPPKVQGLSEGDESTDLIFRCGRVEFHVHKCVVLPLSEVLASYVRESESEGVS